jgi:hypothetical protein
MADKPFDLSELTTLAAEACDLWQEHLAASASDPRAHAELVKMLEPQRQLFSTLFADYAAMMQNGKHAASPAAQPFTASTASAAATPHAATPRPASAAATSDDGALRLAQLAHRVADLERRVADLEQREPAPAKTPRPARSPKSS